MSEGNAERRNILVLGATGQTGQLLVAELLDRGVSVVAIVRSKDRVPAEILSDPALKIVEGSVLEMREEEVAQIVEGCSGLASCLGHNLSFRGIFGPPRRLVRDSLRRICRILQERGPSVPAKVVLMNTAGNRNRGLAEPVSVGQKIVLGLLRTLIPPHADNEEAAEFLRTEIGLEDPHLQWVAVRPDGLIDVPEVTPYDLHVSPTRSAIFNPGKTSRINVAHFMAELLCNQETWDQWKGQMPVIYNQAAD